MSKREAFLLWLLAAVLAWQAGVFTLAVFFCSRVTPSSSIKTVCPDIGRRFDNFSQTSLGAVLGLVGGAAVISTQKKVKDKASSETDPYKEN